MIKQQRLSGTFVASMVLAVSLVLFPGTALAFGCAEHFAAVQSVFDKVVEDMDGMGLDPRTTSQLEELLGQARTYLADAISTIR